MQLERDRSTWQPLAHLSRKRLDQVRPDLLACPAFKSMKCPAIVSQQRVVLLVESLQSSPHDGLRPIVHCENLEAET